MSMFRRRLEHVSQKETYPELPFIGNGGRSLLRYLLGRPMDNVRWTDATFWRDATTGEASRWLRLAGWKHSLVRTLLPYLLILILTMWTLTQLGQDRAALTLALAHVALLLAVLTPILLGRHVLNEGLRLPVLIRVTEQRGKERMLTRWTLTWAMLIEGRREWEREHVLPLARSLAPRLQLSARSLHPSEARQWVSVPRDFREHDGRPVVITLPSSFALEETGRKRLVSAAGERLGIKDLRAQWQMEGKVAQLLLSAPMLPPALVRPGHVSKELAAAAPYTFVLGRTEREALTVSLKEDAPHLAVSAGSGAGKSELMKGLVAQAMHWGWSVLILDWKGESQEWAEGLPGVRYIRGIDALHDVMVSIGEEIEHRRLMSKEQKAANGRVLVVSEEWSITATLLAGYWTNLRATAEAEEKRTMPLRSPAIEAGMKLNFTGRSLGFTQLLVAIRFSARVTNGNADLRESFSVKFLARYSSQTVKMLAPEIRPFPKNDNSPGRWVAVNGETAVVFRGVLWSDEEAREWATGGSPPPASTFGPPTLPGVDATTVVDTTESLWLEDELRAAPLDATDATPAQLEAAPPAPYRLRKLVDISTDLEYLGITHNVLRNAARSDDRGDPNFPAARGGNQFKGYLYDHSEVKSWARNMRAAQAARKEVRP